MMVQNSALGEEVLAKFLSHLPRDGSLISNYKMKEYLNWNDEIYQATRQELVNKGMISKGAGRGGSVRWIEAACLTLLRALPSDETAIPNARLKEALGWDEDFYEEIKRRLLKEGTLRTWKGAGGTVYRPKEFSTALLPEVEDQRLLILYWDGNDEESIQTVLSVLGWREERFAIVKSRLLERRWLSETMVIPDSLRVFISYSHHDEEFHADLLTHLAPLRQEDLISEWHDHKLLPGDEWDSSISVQLERAHVILLLVSPHFLASDYCRNKELKRALERHRLGEAVVMPIILRHCHWQWQSFARLQALPKGGRPIKSWPDRDEAFCDVVAGIKRVTEELRQRLGGRH